MITIRLFYLTIALVLIAVLCSTVSADVLAPNVPETQGFSVQTQMDLVGTATHNDEIAWRMSSEILDANEMMGNNLQLDASGHGMWDYNSTSETYVPNLTGQGQYNSTPDPSLPPGAFFDLITSEPPLNSAGEVQMSDAYTENTIADQGLITYVKSMGIETGYQPENLQNIEATRILTFQGTSMGRAVSDEMTTLDTAGTATSLLGFDPYDCPFAQAIGNCSPPFCNIVQSGSSLDITTGSLATDLGARTVGVYAYGPDEKWPPLPRVDTAPVALDYSVRLTGIDPADPAEGSIAAFIKVHIQDGGHGCPVRAGKAQDLVYSEETTATGSITLFDKLMQYESGLKRLET
jgi:hypothetical protein